MFQRVTAAFLILFPVFAGGAEPIRGFVSVEPFELRLEAIVEVAPFRESWRLGDETIELSERQVVLDNIATLFESGVTLNSPGKMINFTGRSIRFIVPDPETGYVTDERSEIPVEEALVGITLSADVRGIRELTGDWLWFAPGQGELVLEIASRGKPSARLLRPKAGQFSWELEEEIVMPTMLEVPAVERFQSRPVRHLIYLSLLMLVAAAVIIIRRKQKSPSWVGWLTVGGIACGVASFQVRIDRVETPDDPEIEELVYASLRNVYHAFDFRDESSIYDILAESVTGPLLEEVYLEIRQSLELESLGGPRVKVYEIALRDWEAAEDVPLESIREESLRILANWATIGEVTHWGHTHERTNRYEAAITFSAIDQRWKVSELELLNEERVQKVSRRDVSTVEEPAAPDAMIVCEEVKFSYPGESFDLRVDSFVVEKGESVALVGPSGCGKTTLLNLIAGILVPKAGSIVMGDIIVSDLSFPERQALRLAKMGMVPQNFELLDYLTVSDNILTPLRLSGKGKIEREHLVRAAELAERTGMSDLLEKFPTELSQGERQRTALCRGLIGNPALVLADEPTGNLDSGNQERIVSLLLEEAKRLGASVVMITHEPGLLSRFDRVVDLMELRKGAES